MEFHEVLAVLILIASLVAAGMKIRLAIVKKVERVVYAMISAFLLYFAGFYLYIITFDPPITKISATYGRVGILLLIVGLIMQAILNWK
jgi:hypothetical protein